MKNIVNFISKFLCFLQVISSIALVTIGILLIIFSFINIFANIGKIGSISTLLLSNLSLIVIAIAILDVAKYVIEEAVVSELETPKDVRRSLTKFVVIVFVAISLEAIVSVFLANKENFSLLIYPTLLLLTNILLLVGLGVYQKLSIDAEAKQKEPF